MYSVVLLIQPRQTAACFPSKLYQVASRATFAFAFMFTFTRVLHQSIAQATCGWVIARLTRARYKCNRILKLCGSTGHPVCRLLRRGNTVSILSPPPLLFSNNNQPRIKVVVDFERESLKLSIQLTFPEAVSCSVVSQ